MYTSIRIEVKSGQQNYLKNDQQNLIKKIFSLLTLHMQLLATHCPECKSIIDSSVERGQNASSASKSDLVVGNETRQRTRKITYG
jgi:hypothetical protein